MLTGLRLENIALIDSLELAFDRGFSVLTGETGAGKSILLDALDAALGGVQASAAVRLLRSNCERAVIEATFRPGRAALRWLEEQQLAEGEEELVVSREWRRQEDRLSSRSRLNGVMVNRQQLLALRPLLIDLTVQGQTQQLARPGQQKRWLDHLGGAPLEQELSEVRRHWQDWLHCRSALEQAERDRLQLDQQREELDALLAELESAELDDPAEIAQLEAEQDRLVHGVRLQEGLALLIGRLQDGAEQAPSALDHLVACTHELQQMQALDASLQSLKEQCLDLEAGVQDLIRGLEAYGASLESDPERLAFLQDRLAQLKRLERRHGQELETLIQQRDELRDRQQSGGADGLLERLRDQERAACAVRDRGNAALRVRRLAVAARLQEQLMGHLRPMGLANVRFEVAVEPADPSEVAQGDRLVFVVEVTPVDAGPARLMIDDPLPAGFEIDNPAILRGGDVAALDWLELSGEASNTEFRADRFLAAVDQGDGDTGVRRFAYIVRAVSPGEFVRPAALVQNMYDPSRRGRTEESRISVVGPLR